MNFFNKKSDFLIVFSEFMKEIYTVKNYPKERIYIQPNLTDFDYWKDTNEKEIYDIGYSGSAEKKDGIMYIIDSLSALREQGIKKKLIIVGDTVYGKSVIPSLKDYCNQKNVLEQVTFTGLVPHKEVKNYLSKCHVLMLPREYNKRTQAGFPTKLGEYLALNKIVITSNFGDILIYFQHKKNILIVEELKVNKFVEILKLVFENKHLVESIRKESYTNAFNIFDYRSSVYNMLNFIKGGIISSSKPKNIKLK